MIICKEVLPVLRKIVQHNVCNNNNFAVRYRQLVKRVFNVFAILIHDTLQTTIILSNAVMSEAPWQGPSHQHDRLLQLIDGVEFPAVVDSLL